MINHGLTASTNDNPNNQSSDFSDEDYGDVDESLVVGKRSQAVMQESNLNQPQKSNRSPMKTSVKDQTTGFSMT
jgi:hypothetical protein